MLVLTLRENRGSILIGNDIRIGVAAVQGDSVRIGIEAPKEIPIHRIGDRVRTRAELDLMVSLVRGEPLHAVEDRHDRNEFEADMISTPRAKAMSRQVATLQASLEYLREENATLRAKLQNREHVQ